MLLKYPKIHLMYSRIQLMYLRIQEKKTMYSYFLNFFDIVIRIQKKYSEYINKYSEYICSQN